MTSRSSASRVPTLPYGPLDLLVRAALAPREAAMAAWSAWRHNYDIEQTPWNEVRLLGAVAERMNWLEPSAEILPRMKGIQKYLYAQTHICLTACTGALKTLTESQIPVLALKGAARVVADDSIARQRLVRDVDVLVPIDQAGRAFNVLRAAGWDYKPGDHWQDYWKGIDSFASHHAWSVSRKGGDLDLHHFSNYINRLTGDDDGLWKRARVAKWRGLAIHLPGPSDALVLGIVHGLRFSAECNADWIIDVASSLDTERVDWELVLQEGARRAVQALLFTGLTYLRDVIGRDVPQAVTDTLFSQATELQWEELASYAAAPMPRTPQQNTPMLAMAINRTNGSAAAGAGSKRGLLRLQAKEWPQRSVFPMPQGALESDITHLTVRLTGLPRVQPPLTATLCILGLVLSWSPGIPGGNAEGAFQDFKFSISTRLLRQRGVQNLCLTIAPADKAVYPPWRQ